MPALHEHRDGLEAPFPVTHRHVPSVPGLIGFAQQAPDPDRLARFDDLAAAFSSGRCRVCSVSDDSRHWKVGHASQLERRPAFHVGPSGVRVAVHGAIYGDSETSGPVARHASAAAGEDASLVEQLYRTDRAQVGARLEGAFCAVIVDAERATVLLVNDAVGTFPLYWRVQDGRLAFGPTVASVARLLGFRPTLDLRAAADYVHYGLVFGTKTLAQGIAMVPAGSTLVYSWRDGKADIVLNRAPADLFEPVPQERPAYLEQVRHEFNEAVGRACVGEGTLGLSLSGGLDSRAILSAIDTKNVPVATYTVGVRS